MESLRDSWDFRAIALDFIDRAEGIELIAGQRQRHSPSIGIRVTGIEVCRGFRDVKLQFSELPAQPCIESRASVNTAQDSFTLFLFCKGRASSFVSASPRRTSIQEAHSVVTLKPLRRCIRTFRPAFPTDFSAVFSNSSSFSFLSSSHS